MRMNTLSLIVGAALGASVLQVSADALLAPYFKQGPGMITTNYLMKTAGNRVYNARWGANAQHNIHTYYFYKRDQGPEIAKWGFSNQGSSCIREDAYGKFSAWDYVVADVSSGTLYDDKTDASMFGIPNVEGFIVFQEEDLAGVPLGNEGDFSGFVYVFSISGASAIDYKMLNNPTSTLGGDWSNTVISKNIFDVSWWPEGAVSTMWPTIVVGTNMLDSPNDLWSGSVQLERYPLWTNPSQNQGQVYNNDEQVWSSMPYKPIVCAGQVTRDEIITPNAALYTKNGGWTRLWARVTGGTATGAVMQKWEYFLPKGPLTWTIETSGNTAANPGWPGGLANTPY